MLPSAVLVYAGFTVMLAQVVWASVLHRKLRCLLTLEKGLKDPAFLAKRSRESRDQQDKLVDRNAALAVRGYELTWSLRRGRDWTLESRRTDVPQGNHAGLIRLVFEKTGPAADLHADVQASRVDAVLVDGAAYSVSQSEMSQSEMSQSEMSQSDMSRPEVVLYVKPISGATSVAAFDLFGGTDAMPAMYGRVADGVETHAVHVFGFRALEPPL